MQRLKLEIPVKSVEDIARAFVRSGLGGGCPEWNDDQKKMAAKRAHRVAAERAASAK